MERVRECFPISHMQIANIYRNHAPVLDSFVTLKCLLFELTNSFLSSFFCLQFANPKSTLSSS